MTPLSRASEQDVGSVVAHFAVVMEAGEFRKLVVGRIGRVGKDVAFSCALLLFSGQEGWVAVNARSVNEMDLIVAIVGSGWVAGMYAGTSFKKVAATRTLSWKVLIVDN